MLCELKAQRENKDLPDKFWEIKSWKNWFRYQIGLANKLVDKWGVYPIIDALKDKRAKNSFSFKSGFLLSLIKEHYNTRVMNEKIPQEHKEVKTVEGCRGSFLSKKSELDQLDDV